MITAKKALLHLDAKGLVVELFIANEIEPEIRRVYEKDTEITLKVHKWSYGNWIFDKLYSEKYIDYNVDRESVTKAIVKELKANGYVVGYTVDDFRNGCTIGIMTISWKP